MKILYDNSVFQFQRYGGISRYFYELISRLSSKEDIDIDLFQGFHINQYSLSKYKQNFESYWGYKWKYGKPAPMYMSLIFEIPNRILFDRFMGSIMCPSNCSSYSSDIIYHPTYYRCDLDRYNKSVKVLTVHDMIHELYPNQFIDSRFVIKAKKKSINNADKIICVSENTKKDLINIYNVPDDKIKVIYHGNSLEKYKEEYKEDAQKEYLRTDLLKSFHLEKMYSITKPFLLYVGDRKRSYKNFSMLLEIFSARFSDRFDLVCFGGGNFKKNELKIIKNMNYSRKSGKVIRLSGSDHLLASLYKNAFCFIYPSLYEGFGIPLLEAMGMGCPVIAANTSSIPEVVDKAALLFDPTKDGKDDLINAIELLENSESRRNKFISLGIEQEKKFDWAKTADETIKVYENTILKQ